MSPGSNASREAHETGDVRTPENDVLVVAYQEATGNAKWIVDKIWTNARFFTTLTSALITLTVVTIVSFVKEELAAPDSPFLLLLAIS